MEKLMFVLWRPEAMAPTDFAALLRGSLAPALVDLDPLGVQVNVLDEAVQAGAAPVPDGLRRATETPQMEAVVSVWLHSAVPLRRAPFDDVFLSSGLRWCSFLVSESTLLVDPSPAAAGERSRGFAQVAFLRRPEGQARAHWLSRWREHHAEVAIETQSTFEYRQNLVIDRLQAAGPRVDGIVEESFPMEALTDRSAFYDAVGAPDRLARNRARMAASTRTFIDHERGLDVIPTSQYVFRRPLGP